MKNNEILKLIFDVTNTSEFTVTFNFEGNGKQNNADEIKQSLSFKKKNLIDLSLNNLDILYLSLGKILLNILNEINLSEEQWNNLSDELKQQIKKPKIK